MSPECVKVPIVHLITKCECERLAKFSYRKGLIAHMTIPGAKSVFSLRKAALLAMDAVLVNLSIWLGMFLRFEGAINDMQVSRMVNQEAWVTLLFLLSFIASGMYSALWRYAGLPEMIRVTFAIMVAGLAILLANELFYWRLSRAVVILTCIWTLAFAGGVRFAWRAWCARHAGGSRTGEPLQPVMIVGAGYAGSYALALLRRNGHVYGRPVVFVDDDDGKQNLRIQNVPVRGKTADIPRLVTELAIREIIIAIPSLSGERLQNLVALCNSTKCKIRILSNPQDYAARSGKLEFRELNLSDFLAREEVKLDMDSISAYLGGKTILVTGGGGSIGSEICRQIMRFAPSLLLIFDIYENCAYELYNELKQKYGADVPVQVLVGSIRDRSRLDEVFRQYHPQVVFHAAAHKHVPLMEDSPGEAVKNNVLGTLNLLESASSHGVERLVQLSTDKAVNPTSVMGATKRITEMLIQSFARKTTMKCMAVRFGNVLGSHGSVLPLFEAQIKKGGPLTITHPDITRYFMTIPEAAQLVLQAGGIAQSGAIYVLDMGKPVKIMDLAEKLIRFYGFEPGVDIEMKVVGLRAGEKLYEELLMDPEKESMQKTAHDKIFVAPPMQVDDDVLYDNIDSLVQAAEQDDSLVKALLLEAVPTYRPIVIEKAEAILAGA